MNRIVRRRNTMPNIPIPSPARSDKVTMRKLSPKKKQKVREAIARLAKAGQAPPRLAIAPPDAIANLGDIQMDNVTKTIDLNESMNHLNENAGTSMKSIGNFVVEPNYDIEGKSNEQGT